MKLRMDWEGSREVSRKLRKGYELWTEGGRDAADFRNATIRFDDGSGAIVGKFLPL